MMLYKDNDNAANSMGNLQTHGQTYHCVALCACVCVFKLSSEFVALSTST